MFIGNRYDKMSAWKLFAAASLIVFILVTPSYAGSVTEGANTNGPHSILVISSYNPDANNILTTVSDFSYRFTELGGTAVIVTENMNCKSFSEAHRWKGAMREILEKYRDSRRPSMVILLGQEAWSAYLSQDKQLDRDVPVFCGMVSRNAILLPTSQEITLEDWEPTSIDVFDDISEVDIVGGFVNRYDVSKNINLILDFFPETEHIAFISDNSYGGVSMQALVKKEMAMFPNLDLILLDGRKHSIYTISDQISHLPPRTVILIGTWRMDKNDGYFMPNAVYAMMGVGGKIPAFTLASTGMGYWAIGGYNPMYKPIGRDLGTQAYYLLNHGMKDSVVLRELPNRYQFDAVKLKEYGLQDKKLPAGSHVIQTQASFWNDYKYEISIIIAVFVALLLGLLISMILYVRTRRLQLHLEKSEKELLIAKDRAEESNRLKTAFLANMSHEIRTPLNAIVGFSSVIASEQCSEEELAEYSGIIRLNSDLLLRLINDILDISRLESGRLQFNYSDHEIIGLCRNVMMTCSKNGAPGVVYLFEPPVDTFVLRTDSQRLQQILINLVNNAGKFTTEGSIKLEVAIGKEMLVFSVTDTGCGIPLEKQKVVFERFEKLDDMVQGTGLGLSICQLTIEKLGGSIWVDPTYTGGARFIFTHPLTIPNNND